MNRSSFVFLQLYLIGFTTIILFTIFVAYPAFSSQRKLTSSKYVSLVGEAKADNLSNFPIENAQYKISYEKRLDTYYIFVKGANLDSFVENKNKAQLELKNALILESLCSKNVIIASTEGLNVPGGFLQVSNCK